MRLITTIREKDVNPNNPQLADEEHVNIRQVVKFVLFDAAGKIALLHEPETSFLTPGYYLPGGGVEKGEDLIAAVRREAKEETGCEIGDIEAVGLIVEYMSVEKDKRRQETNIFKAKVLEKGQTQMEENEQLRGITVEWFSVDEAIALIKQNKPTFASLRGLAALAEIQ